MNAHAHYERAKDGQWTYCGEANGDAVIFRKGSFADPYADNTDRLRAWKAGADDVGDPNDGAAVVASEWATVDKFALEFILDAANEKEDSTARGATYFDEQGTLRNADGSRSIFDDVDE